MFVHLAVHHPKPGHEADLLAEMHRVDRAAEGSPGLIRMGAWRDAGSGRLVGLAMWESREAWEAAAPGIFATVDRERIARWSQRPPDSLHLDPA